ncbi:MAG TPA: hypothetical protein VG389_02770 [Myxococcota bacterium]|jgi:hypothetical protein|nr:hypothetical protein [Myxococcota bacterium]
MNTPDGGAPPAPPEKSSSGLPLALTFLAVIVALTLMVIFTGK